MYHLIHMTQGGSAEQTAASLMVNAINDW